MARAPRIHYPGALYHVTSRGNRRAHIYLDDRDFLIWQDHLATTVERYNITVHAFCQMPNHYHLLVETVEGNLSAAMHYFNSTYSQRFNKRHQLIGHVVQGRFHAVVVNRDAQLLELARYISLNPVRAELARNADEWRWGSHPHLCGIAPPLTWLNSDWLLGRFAGQGREQAIERYRLFVNVEEAVFNPLADHTERGLDGALARRRAALSLEEYRLRYSNRNEAMARAHFSTAHTIEAIARHFGVSARTVARANATLGTALAAELVSVSGCDP